MRSHDFLANESRIIDDGETDETSIFDRDF